MMPRYLSKCLSQRPTTTRWVQRNLGLLMVASVACAGVASAASPDLTIISPISNGSYISGQGVVLEGRASDGEGGDISETIDWYSDVGGYLGTGALVSLDSLTTGTHYITAEVADSESEKVKSSRPIRVRERIASVISDLTSLQSQADSFVDSQSELNAPGGSNAPGGEANSPQSRNFGSQGTLVVGGNGNQMAFIRFALNNRSEPSEESRLTLFVINVDRPGVISLHLVLEDWQETGITARDEPEYDSYPWITFTVSETDVGAEIEVDLTSMVSYWHFNPDRNYGFALRSAGEARVVFASRESSQAPPAPGLKLRRDPNATPNS